jgi:glutaminase
MRERKNGLREAPPGTAVVAGAAPVGSSPSPIDDYFRQLHAALAGETGGAVADYIPELARADPDAFGIAIATVDGHRYTVGDADRPFTIQSVSKPFLYGYALRTLGREAVRARVGVEPTGEAFNAIVLDERNNRPFNPMVNSGAIAVTALVAGDDQVARERTVLDLLSDFAARPLDLDAAVYRSELATGHRNRAIAYLMLNSGMLAADPTAALDLYFRQCAVRVTCADLAMMAATLANYGTNPSTGKTVLDDETVRDVLTVMSTCGMYDYAGQWSYDVGLPAKSGVSGAILAVIPGQLGIAVYAPRLDRYGNSVRGVAACRRLSADFGLHGLHVRWDAGNVVRREYTADVVSSNRRRPPRERAVLERDGHRIRVLELQGSLFFASVERLLRRLAEIVAGARLVVFDLKRVQLADAAGQRLLRRFVEEHRPEGCEFALSHVDDTPVQLGDLAARAVAAGAHVFAETDAALEYGEDAIVAAEVPVHDDTRFALGRMEVFKGLEREDLRRLEDIVQPRRFEAGTTIMREGDRADLFFVVARGSVGVQLRLDGGRTRRIACIGPGLTFGEMSLLDGARRSADVVALETVVAYGVSVDALHALGSEHPHVLVTILTNINRDLSERLRRANDEIRALA